MPRRSRRARRTPPSRHKESRALTLKRPGASSPTDAPQRAIVCDREAHVAELAESRHLDDEVIVGIRADEEKPRGEL